MRALLFIPLCCLFLMSNLGYADQRDPKLDPLFDALKASQSLVEARQIEAQIWQIWGEVSDHEQAELYDRSIRAMENSDLLGAIEVLTELIEKAPTFAEAWNKRATVYYLAGKFDESVSDIQRTLALEPRHFGALSGFGLILLRTDQTSLALRSFEAALEINPHMPAARAHVERLRESLDGEPL